MVEGSSGCEAESLATLSLAMADLCSVESPFDVVLARFDALSSVGTFSLFRRLVSAFSEVDATAASGNCREDGVNVCAYRIPADRPHCRRDMSYDTYLWC